MSTDEHELIRDYAAEGSQAAFTALVNRHVDLVYTAARRQVRSPDLAEEVTQTVFIALARHARELKPGTPLAAWLYLVTRRAALDALRRESRRLVREQTAFELAAMKSNSPAWSQIEPLLDEAMESLAETDRRAILLRYFENLSLRDVGQRLGSSEDAAQKRLGRALEQLRAFFSKRGVTIGATALAADLAGAAVQAAPVGLGLSLSSATALVGAAGQIATLETAKTIAMTSLQKTLIVTTLATIVGAGLYQGHLISRRDDQIAELQQQVDQWRGETRRLQAERDKLTSRLADAQRESEAVRSRIAGEEGALPAGDPAVDSELKAIAARVNTLKAQLTQHPEQQIPELRFLTVQDWMDAVAKHNLDTDDDVRTALAELRGHAKANFTEPVSDALWKYTEANDGKLPTDIMQLMPFFDPPVEPELLQRYGVMNAGIIRDIPMSTYVIAEIGPQVDNRDGTLYLSGPRTQITQRNVTIHSGSYSDITSTVLSAVSDFIKSRDAQPLTDPAQLQPFLKTPVDPARLQGFWNLSGLPNHLHSPTND
jgi:RNA polymerase sigma factor (sigma-70 family)